MGETNEGRHRWTDRLVPPGRIAGALQDSRHLHAIPGPPAARGVPHLVQFIGNRLKRLALVTAVRDQGDEVSVHFIRHPLMGRGRRAAARLVRPSRRSLPLCLLRLSATASDKLVRPLS